MIIGGAKLFGRHGEKLVDFDGILHSFLLELGFDLQGGSDLDLLFDQWLRRRHQRLLTLKQNILSKLFISFSHELLREEVA